MLAKTAMAEFPKTVLKRSSLTGEKETAGTESATKMMNKEKNEAKIPAITI
jgi:hypothetical protein